MCPSQFPVDVKQPGKSTAVSNRWTISNGSLSGSISKSSVVTPFFVLFISHSTLTDFEPSYTKIAVPEALIFLTFGYNV